MPRIRGGTEYPYESCVRIIVRKKLAPSELHPNSGEEWAALYNLFLTEKYTGHAETFVNLRGTKQIMIPSTLAGWATDIVEKENTEQ